MALRRALLGLSRVLVARAVPGAVRCRCPPSFPSTVGRSDALGVYCDGAPYPRPLYGSVGLSRHVRGRSRGRGGSGFLRWTIAVRHCAYTSLEPRPPWLPKLTARLKTPNQTSAPPPRSGLAKSERIAKRIARAGLCSRREAEQWVADRRVQVNGKTITSPATLVCGDSIVVVDGATLHTPGRPRLYLYHKPRKVIVTSNDGEQARRTIADELRALGLPETLKPVGRLDYMTSGLMVRNLLPALRPLPYLRYAVRQVTMVWPRSC